jgi:hypothetical protein
VLVPAYAWAGPHVWDQLRQASGFTSIASPWRALVNLADLVPGGGAVRGAVVPAALVLAGLLAFALARRVGALPAVPASQPAAPAADGAQAPDGDPAAVVRSAARASVVLAAAWVLTAPYALPWYDALVWAPLALVGPSLLDVALLVRLGVLALAYVPGRVVGLSPLVEDLTLGARRYVAPALMLAVVLAVARWARAAPRPAPEP